MNEKLKQELRILGSLVLAGVSDDQDKAADVLYYINSFIVSNPKIVPFFSREENQAALKNVKLPKSASPMELMSFVGELKNLSKSFKES